uniref:Uncharacterized protein n=1 Tax=Rousettus aegyptiacus TaxID=9407 RepID=A0A7J8KAS3_ROUAE|nr:hypothetical protein HJG63_007833 [Rousettus aegyptiacus]
MSIRLHRLCYLQTTSFCFLATMLWVAKYFTFFSLGTIWKIFSVSLHYDKLSVLGKLETRMEKRTLHSSSKPGGQFCPQETFGNVTLEICYWHPVGRGQGCCCTSCYPQKIPPQQRISQHKWKNSVRRYTSPS